MSSIIRNLFEWTISTDNQELLKEIWIIDFHSHVWNILQYDQEQLFDLIKKFPVDIRTLGWNYGNFKAPWKIMEILMHTRIIDNILKESWKKRNSSATFKTFEESMVNSFTEKAVLLPIPPHQTFDNLKELESIDKNNRIIYFTWVDFTKLIDLEWNKVQSGFDELEKQFEKDVNNWAKWLKIHPIIQWISADSDIVNDVVKLWEKHDLPVIFHTWVTEYCKKDEDCKIHKPEYWEIKYFINLAKNHPDLKLVIGHSWLFQVDEVAEYLSIYDNVVVDTSFQWKEKINLLLNKFWENRLMYASDWPYWDRIPAINVMLDTLDWKRRLIEKIMRDNAMYSMNMKKEIIL